MRALAVVTLLLDWLLLAHQPSGNWRIVALVLAIASFVAGFQQFPGIANRASSNSARFIATTIAEALGILGVLLLESCTNLATSVLWRLVLAVVVWALVPLWFLGVLLQARNTWWIHELRSLWLRQAFGMRFLTAAEEAASRNRHRARRHGTETDPRKLRGSGIVLLGWTDDDDE